MLQNVPVTNSASKADSATIKSRTRAELVSPDLNMSNTTRVGVLNSSCRDKLLLVRHWLPPSYCWFPDHNPILFYLERGGRRGCSTKFSDFSVTFKFLLFFFADVKQICVVPDLYTQTVFSLPYQLITKWFKKWSRQKVDFFFLFRVYPRR
jgi:hypothetical protein